MAEENGNTRKGFGYAQEHAHTALVVALDALRSTIRTSMETADAVQKISLSLGQTFKETNETLGPTMKSLHGDFGERFRASIAGMEAGLQGNTAGIARLINQQRLTGTQSANTAKAFASLETVLGLSREETNKLANSFIVTGEEWQVSTDKLVNTIDVMKERLPWVEMAGMGTQFITAISELKAELPTTVHGHLDRVVRQIFDPAAQNIGELAKVGLGGFKDRLAAEKDSDAWLRMFKEGIMGATKVVDSLIGTGSQAEQAAAFETFKEFGASIRVVNENFGKRVKEAAEETDKFAQTLGTLKDDIFEPLYLAFGEELYPVLIESVIPALKSLTIATLSIGIFILNVLDPAFVLFERAIKGVIGQLSKLDAAYENAGKVTLMLSDIFGFFVNIIRRWIYGPLMAITDFVLTRAKAVAETLGVFEGALAEAIDSILGFVRFFDPSYDEKDTRSDEERAEALTGTRLAGDILKQMKLSFEEHRKAAEGVESIDRKTEDPIKTSPEYLDATVNTIGRAMERLLGMPAPGGEMVVLLEELNESNKDIAMSNAKIATDGPPATSIGLPT